MERDPEGHKRLDRISLELHRACAAKLRAHPELLAVARDNLDRWSKLNERTQPYWDTWREMLDLPLDELLALMQEESERMTALRHTSPFAGLLDIAERRRILRQ
jgi:hypothetical protein